MWNNVNTRPSVSPLPAHQLCETFLVCNRKPNDNDFISWVLTKLFVTERHLFKLYERNQLSHFLVFMLIFNLIHCTDGEK